MIGKCFGLLAVALVLTCQAPSYAGLFGNSRGCHTTHYRCYMPHYCCRPCPPCPPCPPICHATDCVYNATDKVLTVSVTHGGGTNSRQCLKPGSWFKFSFDPSKHSTAVVVAYESGTSNLVINQVFPLLNNPPAPYGCIHIVGGGYAAGSDGAAGGATLQRSGAAGPGIGAP